MQPIEHYKFSWRPSDDSGMLHLVLKDGKAVSLEVDSAAEASFLMDLLRQEDQVFFDPEHQLIMTGLDHVKGHPAKE